MAVADQPSETNGQKFERLAFAYCKIATVSLLCGRFALPVAATLCAGLYLVAFFSGKQDTRCWAKYPLLIASFWIIVAVLWFIAEFVPNLIPIQMGWIHPRA